MEEYLDENEILALKQFNEQWGKHWDCQSKVDERSLDERIKCREAVNTINRLVVAPAFDAAWENYQPHQTLYKVLENCTEKWPSGDVKPFCRLPQWAYAGLREGKRLSNGVGRQGKRDSYRRKSNEYSTAVVVTDADRNSIASDAIDLQVEALINLASIRGAIFHGIMKDAVRKTNGAYERGPQKTSFRIHQKAVMDYEGDVSRVVDVERGTGIYDSSDDLAKAVTELSNLPNTDPRFNVVRVKDNFSEIQYSHSHYRDAKFSIEIDGLVGELKLNLRKLDHLDHEVLHSVYNVQRVVMDGKSITSHRGLVSVPLLRFTRNDGGEISDRVCLNQLHVKLLAVLPKGCTYSGGYFSDDAINVYLGVTNVAAFAKLRDTIIFDGNFSVALDPFEVDIGSFIELYATNLMKFVEFTSHQEEQLRKIRDADIALLLSPAGGGKTFVAIQCMLELLHAGTHVLFVSQHKPLALFVARWLILASGKGVANAIKKVRVLIDNDDCKFSDGPMCLKVQTIDGRDALIIEKPQNYDYTYGIAVIDEAHHLLADATLRTQFQKLSLERYLFLGDASQSSVNEDFDKESICKFLNLEDAKPIVEAKLTEVVRSTKRIVAGASSFQLIAGSKVETKTYTSSEGFPLVSHLFPPVADDERIKAYAHYVVKALLMIQKNFHNANLDDKVMIACPDDDFVRQLRKPLEAELRLQMKEEDYILVSALQASAALPREAFANTEDFPRWLVLDSIARVDGLERLAVIATGLDRSIQEKAVDVHTRSSMYRALTRAQLSVAVVNEYVKDGFLEFLLGIKFNHDSFNEKKTKKQLSSTAADKIQAKAVQKKTYKSAGVKWVKGKVKSIKPRTRSSKNPVPEGKKTLISQSIWDTRLSAKDISYNENPTFSPFKPKVVKMNKNSYLAVAEKGGKFLAEELKKKKITDIDLTACDLGDENSVVLANALFQNKTVTRLDLGENGIGDIGAKALGNALKVNKTLSTFDLSYNDEIRATGVRVLANALGVNKTLTTVDFSGIKFGTTGSRELANALEANKSVTNLKLVYSAIGFEGVTSLADLTGALLHPAGGGIIDISEALKTNATVSKIDLSHNAIRDAGSRALAKALMVNETMSNIKLAHAEVGLEGVEALAEALKVNPSLTKLDLGYNCDIGDEGAIALAEALHVNETLSILKLADCGIGDAGAIALAEALKVNTSVYSIVLADSTIGDSGARALAEALKVNKSLSNINLARGLVGDEGVLALAEAQKLNKWVTVEYDYNK